jgi:1,4-dihydroxy-2-naphthoate octaprenyltransferase
MNVHRTPTRVPQLRETVLFAIFALGSAALLVVFSDTLTVSILGALFAGIAVGCLAVGLSFFTVFESVQSAWDDYSPTLRFLTLFAVALIVQIPSLSVCLCGSLPAS